LLIYKIYKTIGNVQTLYLCKNPKIFQKSYGNQIYRAVLLTYRQDNMSQMSVFLEPCMESIFEILYPKPSYGLPLGEAIKVKMANTRAYDQKFENRKRKAK